MDFVVDANVQLIFGIKKSPSGKMGSVLNER